MAETTTITVRIPVELRDKLDRLAKAMERSRSYVAVQALEDYVRYETEVLDGIEEAEADFEAGRFYTHEEAMAEFDKMVEEAHQAKTGVQKKVVNG
jgi:predicted transcriptional regulator